MYLWVNPNQTGEINFGKVCIYNHQWNHFECKSFHDIINRDDKVIEFIKNFLREHNREQGINMNILSEWGRGYSFSFSANFATIVTTALYMLVGKLTHKDLQNYDEFMQSDIFHEIEMTARQIELLIIYGNASWENMYTLYKSYAPALFYCEEFDPEIKLEKIKDIKYSFTSFAKLFNIPENNDLPFDYAIIFSWLQSNTQKVEQAIQLDEKKLQKYADFIDEKILPVTQLKKNVHFINTLHEGIYNQFVNMFSISNVMILESLEKIFTEGGDNRNIQYLIDTINSVRYLFYMLEKSPSDFIERFTSLFQEESKNKEKIGMVNCYSSKLWGSYMVVMRQGTNRKYFFDAIEKMKSEYPDLLINYMSWVDGMANDWVIAEQYISQGIFSTYVKKDRVYVKNNVGDNILGDYNEIFATHKEWLLLDAINNRIYLNGRKLNSNDIPSQTTTINILDKLIDNIGKDIPNRSFDVSSYSKNKNEMIGKIVIPLVSLLERELWKKFPLICKGSIHDFYMKINITDIKISIVKKI